MGFLVVVRFCGRSLRECVVRSAESVCIGHPDKLCDLIAEHILDDILAKRTFHAGDRTGTYQFGTISESRPDSLARSGAVVTSVLSGTRPLPMHPESAFRHRRSLSSLLSDVARCMPQSSYLPRNFFRSILLIAEGTRGIAPDT